MIEQEKIILQKRIADYTQLKAAAVELSNAIDQFDDKHYTMSTSQVRMAESIVIQFSDTEHRILLGANKIAGCMIARELLPMLKDRRDEIWKAMEKI